MEWESNVNGQIVSTELLFVTTWAYAYTSAALLILYERFLLSNQRLHVSVASSSF